MVRIVHCPVCGTPPERRWPALVAPFIAEAVLQRDVERTELHECGSCGLRYFADRFTEAELGRLYADYRGPRYFDVRHRHEPWYTEAFNRHIGHDAQRAAARQAGLARFFAAAGVPGPFASILDYGGDTGHLIPRQLTSNAWVYDISGVAPVDGVRPVRHESELQPGGYALVLLSHVLEHVPDPVTLLRRLRGLVPDRDGLLYVEVPLERPWMGLQGHGALTRSYLDAVRRAGPLLTALDFYSTACRVKARFVPPFGFAKLHEHINFFSASALRAAVEQSGFSVLRMSPASAFGEGHSEDSLACLARVAPIPS